MGIHYPKKREKSREAYCYWWRYTLHSCKGGGQGVSEAVQNDACSSQWLGSTQQHGSLSASGLPLGHEPARETKWRRDKRQRDKRQLATKRTALVLHTYVCTSLSLTNIFASSLLDITFIFNFFASFSFLISSTMCRPMVGWSPSLSWGTASSTLWWVTRSYMYKALKNAIAIKMSTAPIWREEGIPHIHACQHRSVHNCRAPIVVYVNTTLGFQCTARGIPELNQAMLCNYKFRPLKSPWFTIFGLPESIL